MNDFFNAMMPNFDIVAIIIISAIIALGVVSIVLVFTISARYKAVIKELKEANINGIEVYKFNLLNSIVAEYKEVCVKNKGKHINTQAIIESNFYTSAKDMLKTEKFLKNSNRYIMFLGIAGTLYNLVYLSRQVASIFAADPATLQALSGSVQQLMGYIVVAFSTTFVAIIASLIYSIFASFANIGIMRENLITKLENYLDNILYPTLISEVESAETVDENKTDGTTNILYMFENTANSMLETTSRLESSIGMLNNNMNKFVDSLSKTQGLEKKEDELEAINKNVLKNLKINDGDAKQASIKQEPKKEEVKPIPLPQAIEVPPKQESLGAPIPAAQPLNAPKAGAEQASNTSQESQPIERKIEDVKIEPIRIQEPSSIVVVETPQEEVKKEEITPQVQNEPVNKEAAPAQTEVVEVRSEAPQQVNTEQNNV